MHTQTHGLEILLSDWEQGKPLKTVTHANKDGQFWSWLQTGFLRWCWKQLRLPMKISAYENQFKGELFRFLGSGLTSHMPTVPDSPFTLALSHQLQKSSCFYDSPWEKVIMPPSALTFWVYVITISSLAWEWWKIPASSFYREESCWNNLIYDYDDHLSCRRWQLVTWFLSRKLSCQLMQNDFHLTYHCTSIWKILSCLLLPFCLHRQITLQYETFLMGRKRDPYLENSVSTQVKQWENDLSY